MLLGLTHRGQTGLTRREPEMLGLTLGADVPVFVHGRDTFAEGVGEAFSDVDLPAACYLVLHPAVNVPTAAIFGAAELKRDTPVISPADWRHDQGRNDLEAVACARFPAVAEHLAWLRQFAPQALMTGSGACVFAGFPTRAEAEAVFSRLPAQMTGWVAAGLPEHPLAGL